MNPLFTLERVSDPEIECFTLTQAKRYLRMFEEATDEDDDVTDLIRGAREWVEEYTGRALIDQAWRLTIIGPQVAGDAVTGYILPVARPGFYGGPFTLTPLGEILLRRSPVLALTSVSVRDATGITTVVGSTQYEVREADSKYPRLFPLSNATWFTGGVIGGDLQIEFRAGFADRENSPQQGVEAVPKAFIQAMKLWMEAQYDRDSKTMQMLMDMAERLVETQRAQMGMA